MKPHSGLAASLRKIAPVFHFFSVFSANLCELLRLLPGWKIEQQDLGISHGDEFQMQLVGNLCAVTFPECDSVETHCASRHVRVRFPAWRDFFLDRLTATERGDIEIGVLIDLQSAVPACMRRDDAQSARGSIT